jgi:hypothetical protein
MGWQMLGLMRDQWIVNRGVREIVVFAEQDGFLIPAKREEMVKGILECSRDLDIAHKGISAHEQVMIAVMAFFGIAMGPLALSDAARWAAEYAARHKQRHVLGACMEAAAKLVAAIKT